MKKIVIVLVCLIVAAVTAGIYLYNKPHKKVESEKGMQVSATELVKAFTTNEAQANTTYLNKAILVSGVVASIENNQDGGKMVILDAADPMSSVQCAMRDKGVQIEKGKQVSIKGFCSGNGITGVTLTDCVLE